MPPVAHPLLGDAARDASGLRPASARACSNTGRASAGASSRSALVAVFALGVGRVVDRCRRSPAFRVLAVVACVALVCSLSPERTIGAFTFVRPSALLYHVVPMFRSYARFGVVVQLMAALLAGIGVDCAAPRPAPARAQIAVRRARGRWRPREYAVLPSALWRDVLPTRRTAG